MNPDAKLICDAIFDRSEWIQIMLNLGTIWLFSKEEDLMGFLESTKSGSNRLAYVMLSVTKQGSTEHIYGSEAELDTLKDCLKCWEWADEGSHELILSGSSITVNIGDLCVDKKTSEYRGIAVNISLLIRAAEEKGTWEAMRPYPTCAINSAWDDFCLMGIEYDSAYVIECPEQSISWQLIEREMPTPPTRDRTSKIVDEQAYDRQPPFLPKELWQIIHRFATPRSRYNLSLTSSQTSLLSSDFQRWDRIWLTIFRGEKWASRMQDQNIELVLLSCDFERLISGSSHVEKPYLVLAPVRPERALQFYEDDFLSDLNSNQIDVGCMEADFPSFTLNFEAVLLHDNSALVPEYSGLIRSGTVRLLSYINTSILRPPTKREAFSTTTHCVSETSTGLHEFTLASDLGTMGPQHRSVHTGLKEFFAGIRSFDTLSNLETSYSCKCCVAYAQREYAQREYAQREYAQREEASLIRGRTICHRIM